MSIEDLPKKPLHKVVPLVIENSYIQSLKEDVAIPYVAGPPGGGKTASIFNMCKQNYWGLVSTHLALKPIEELGGIPQFKDCEILGRKMIATVWSFPDVMSVIYEECDRVKKEHARLVGEGIIQTENPIVSWLIDDVHLCGEDHLALMFEALGDEKRLRGYDFPDNLCIMLAGNHGSNKAGAVFQNSAVINRCWLMPVFTDFDAWKTNFALDYGVHQGIMSFLGNNMYSRYFHEEEEVDMPWASPRAWTRLSTFLKRHESWHGKIPSDDVLYISSGHVGKEAATHFTEYYAIYNKFDIKSILNDSDNFQVPEDDIDQYALIYSIITYIGEKKVTKTTMTNISKIAYKYLNTKKELGVMFLTELKHVDKVLKNKKLFTTVCQEIENISPGLIRKTITTVKNA